MLLSRHGGQHPYLSVRITEPCADGHPGKVTAGVTERFMPSAEVKS